MGDNSNLEPGFISDWKFTMHIVGMTISFGLCIPIVVSMAIAKVYHRDGWFRYHRMLSVVAIAAMFVGLVPIIFHMQEVHQRHGFEAHHVLGYMLACNICINPIMGTLRPDKDHPRRFIWLTLHRISGYGALIGGFSNSMLGYSIVNYELPYLFETVFLYVGFAIASFIIIVAFFLRGLHEFKVLTREVEEEIASILPVGKQEEKL